MPKGSVGDARAETGLMRLREMIRELEVGLVSLKGQGEYVAELLRRRDEIAEALAQLGERVNLRPEETRVETIDNVLYRKSPRIVRELRGLGGLSAIRIADNPPEDRWWWYLDQTLNERRRRSAVRTLITISAVLIVLIAGNFVVDHFFGLSPLEKAAESHRARADQHFRAGDHGEAISEFERAVEIVPELAEAQVMLAVLYEQEGRLDASRTALAMAEESAGSRLKYQILLARTYTDVEQFDKALTVIEEAYQISPTSPEVFLVRGNIYESQEKFAEAADDFLEGSELAAEQEQSELYVLLKMRLGMILQRGAASGFSGAGP